jgi:hypothetical protein
VAASAEVREIVGDHKLGCGSLVALHFQVTLYPGVAVSVKPDSDDEGNPVEQLRAADWPRLRRAGRERYVWFHHTLPFGAPMGLFLVIWVFADLGYSPKQLLTIRGAALAYFILGISLAVAYVIGRFEWAKRERKYNQKPRD